MSLYLDFLAGCVGGSCSVLIGHPLDTIKTWQQASNSRVGIAMNQIFQRNKGFNGFYRGMLFPLVTTGAINSILFGVYGNHLRQLQGICHSEYQMEQLEYEHIFWAGSVAGFVQSFIACPVELIKVRLQTQSYYNEYLLGQRKTPFKLFKKILKNDGISGLYRGLIPMMFRDVLPYGIYMMVYQKTMKYLDNCDFIKTERQYNTITKRNGNGGRETKIEFMISILAGAWAGILSWVCVIPFDVVKTVMQAEENIKYKNIRHCVTFNVARYGWKSLFRGSWILVVRAIPVNAATFFAYEYCLSWFQYMSGVQNTYKFTQR